MKPIITSSLASEKISIVSSQYADRNSNGVFLFVRVYTGGGRGALMHISAGGPLPLPYIDLRGSGFTQGHLHQTTDVFLLHGGVAIIKSCRVTHGC